MFLDKLTAYTADEPITEGIVWKRAEFTGPGQGLQFNGILCHGLIRFLTALIKPEPFSDHKAFRPIMRLKQSAELSISLFRDCHRVTQTLHGFVHRCPNTTQQDSRLLGSWNIIGLEIQVQTFN